MDTQHSSPLFDAHLHLFYLDEGDYAWLKNGLPAWPKISKIQKSFSTNDLVLNKQFKLTSYCHIEAGFDNQAPENELAMLENKNADDFSAIGYLQLDAQPHIFADKLKRFLSFDSFIGIRDITEGDDAKRLLNKHLLANLAELEKAHLLLEVQFELSQLAITERLVSLASQFPKLNFVVNHAGLVRQNDIDKWQAALGKIAPCTNIHIKYSGFEMQVMTLEHPFRETIFNSLLTQLGQQRIMFASNFPVCLMESSYLALWQHYANLCQDNPALWHQLSYQNAYQLYRRNRRQ